MTKVFPRGREAFELDRSQLDPAQGAFFDRVSAGPRGRVPINLRAWLHNVPFAEAVEPFGLYVSETAPSISKREKEITVLVNARFWQARFEWAMHVRHATKAGLTASEIEAIRVRKDPCFDDRGESLTYRLADGLHEDRAVDDALYQEALAHFGHEGVADRIGLAGLYTMIAMTLNFYDVAIPEGGA
ncbi:MAG: carboxymuconolactone decarboxylase family protein [Alcaligenaceae bacterium]|nr:carboxymuconolactone decarboxylase family protein [Alcaligenaceae bacterium SAGV5]MPS54428.1 carboxymuconolactone decarboxylase family protein [Alcaligenaceae bacterium SAGV3]MPT58568.1 carboxymuconolactone decarboxylase family protein [Alcaligenaceae bacterium]